MYVPPLCINLITEEILQNKFQNLGLGYSKENDSPYNSHYFMTKYRTIVYVYCPLSI